jgi:hypothetical protein
VVDLAAGGDTEGPSVPAETLFGAVGALAVLVFVFASFLALVPLVIAAVSILATLLLVLGLTDLTDVSFVVQFLIALVGPEVASITRCCWSPAGAVELPAARRAARVLRVAPSPVEDERIEPVVEDRPLTPRLASDR